MGGDRKEAVNYSIEKVNLVYKCAYAGYSPTKTANALDISTSTLRKWLKVHKEFKESYELGRKNRVEDKVPIIEDALFKSAIGYKTVDTITKSTMEIDPVTKKEVEVIEKIEKREKTVAPNVLAQIFALKNLKKEVYSDKVTIDGKLSFTELMKQKSIEDKNNKPVDMIDLNDIDDAEIIEDDE